MSSELQSIILGFIQGLTEFLPVSSSGHLVVGQKFFGLDSQDLSLSIVAHMGTLIAIIFFYRKEFYEIVHDLVFLKGPLIVNTGLRLILLVCIANIPSAFVGIFLKSYIKIFFGSTQWVAIFFIMTAGVLLGSKKVMNKTDKQFNMRYISHHITFFQALCIGLAQACAICPGLSRAGLTISIGLLLGLQRQSAAFFSFLISVPAILGASFLDYKSIGGVESAASLIILFLSSLVFGLFGLLGVTRVLSQGRLHYFSFYLIGLAFFLFVFE